VPLHGERDAVIRRELFLCCSRMKRKKGAKFVTSSAEEYRRYARQCLEIASPTFQDKEARATLLGFAQAWLRLAHLALANRHIGELTVQVARQRVIVKHALDTGQGSEMAESLLDALEGSLRIFEKHRIFLLSCSGSARAVHGCEARRVETLRPDMSCIQMRLAPRGNGRFIPRTLVFGGQLGGIS
jgi:hypothetical protein